MVLKLLAILPSGSAGKFLKKIWNLEKWGGTTTTIPITVNTIPKVVGTDNITAILLYIAALNHVLFFFKKIIL